MKTQLILISLLLLGVVSVVAQSKTPCEDYFISFETFYKEEFNEKSFLTTEGRNKTLDVINSIVENCPSYSKNIYVYGEEMLKKIIHPLNIGEEKITWTNHLTGLYDKQSLYFAETKKENEVKKVVFAYNNKAITDQQALNALETAYKTGKNEFTTEALNLYANLVVTEFFLDKSPSAGNIKKADILNSGILSKINRLETALTVADPKDTKRINSEITSLGLSAKNISTSLKTAKLDCQGWSDLYKDDFEKNKTQAPWLENALLRLKDANCDRNNELFSKMAEQYYELEKTSKSAFYLANIALYSGDTQTAAAYFKESADLEPNATEKARLYYRIADLYKRTDKALVQEFTTKAIASNPGMIEPYIILSQLYADAEGDCFSNEFEEKAKYLLAAQTIEKIIKINPDYEKTAKKISADFMEKAPTKNEIRKAKMRGKTIQFGCWINQSIVVP